MLSLRSKGARQRGFTLILLCLGWLLVWWPQPISSGQNAGKPKTILVLYWYGRDFVLNVRLDASIRRVLSEEPAGSIEYYPEYLESNRFPGERQLVLFRDYLAQKYAGRKIDAVVTYSPPALNFALKYCNELFANTPIVFNTFRRPAFDRHPAGMTGVVTDRPFARTLDLALTLHPNIAQAYVIVGTSEHDREFEADIRDELKPLESKVGITYLSELPLHEVIGTVRNAPDHSLVLYVRYSVDEPGKSIDPFDALSLIAASSRVPVYSLGSMSLIGRGTIGGYSADTEIGEATMARMALDVAKGKRTQDIPVLEIPNVLRFDSKQLKRWSIDELQLPQGSVVLFKEVTFWQRYKWRIVGVAGIFVLQSLLIVGLLIERNRRKRADSSQRETQERNRAILSALPDLMFLQSREGVYLDYHARQPELLPVAPEEFLGKSMHDVLPENLARHLDTYFQKATSTGETQICEYDLGVNGTRRWFEARIASCDEDKLLSVVRDVTARKTAETELRLSEQRFAKVFAANPQPMSLTTVEEGRYLDVNDSFLEMSGYTRSEVIGHTSLELNIWLSPADRNRLIEPLLRSREVHNVETEFRTKNGQLRTLLSSGELIELSGQPSVLIASSDITERKRLELQLQRSEREFSTLVENSPDVISRLDHKLRYIYVSPVLERISSQTPEYFLGKTPHEVGLPDYDWNSFEHACQQAFATGSTIVREFEYHNRQYRSRLIPEFSADGGIESLISISEDVTERLRAEKELRNLTARLFSLQDEERRRIARELHDGTAQNLFAISINLAKLGQLDETQKQEMQRLIGECTSLGNQSLQEIRTLSYLLHPPLLDQVGLVGALKWYAEGLTKRSGIDVNVRALPIDRLSSDVELALFRVVQEALTNVLRHSESKCARIKLESRADEVLLEIVDRGHGLTKSTPAGRSEEDIGMGVGIPGMRQRLQQLGGRLELESNDHGTTVRAVVPTNGTRAGSDST
jgi:PAS domain S-box-containing protein